MHLKLPMRNLIITSASLAFFFFYISSESLTSAALQVIFLLFSSLSFREKRSKISTWALVLTFSFFQARSVHL